MPVLQGATALVAALFLLAVVGQLLLPGALPGTTSAPAAVERESVAVPEATAVAALAAAPLEEVTEVEEPTAEPVQLMAAEAPAEVTAPPNALAVEATSALSEALDAQAAAAASAAPPGMGVGGEGMDAGSAEADVTGAVAKELGGPAGVGAVAGVTLVTTATVEPSATPSPTSTAAPSATPVPSATAEPSLPPAPTETAGPTLAPEPTATLVPTIEAAPTLLAELSAEAGPVALDRSAQATEDAQRTAPRWLPVAELALGIAFVVLGTLTIALMLRRLRRS